ncbi:hypothetical protein Tsubulata_029960 [Turnera subulata]|uniref:F-box domain-containing protein n=1 Tax=Turnera subulata TaxID=218843 RepID=A0A9Q0F589_9ROSI|nr:hypothetical protein Tsubulata_029960 [Turnera subulata]
MAHDECPPKRTRTPPVLVSASINDLDEELLSEILKRLPSAKQTTACKLVSKNWCSLISTPFFVSRFVDHYHKRHPDEPTPYAFITTSFGDDCAKLFVHDHAYKSSESLMKLASYLPSTYHPGLKYCLSKIITSCNDLLLCSSQLHSKLYYIFNPQTKKAMPLPPFTTEDPSPLIVGLVCHNQKQSFRVVRIREVESTSKLLIAVETYCREVNKWDEVVLEPRPDQFRFGYSSCKLGFTYSTSAFSWNGFMHWLSKDNKTVVYNPYKPGLFSMIDNPASGNGCLGASQGSLVFFLLVDMGDASAAQIWELTDYNTTQWIIKHSVPLKQLCKSLKDPLVFDSEDPSELTKDLKLLSVDPNENHIVYLANFGKLYLCDLKRKELEVANSSALDGIGSDRYGNGAVHLMFPSWPTTIPAVCPNT